MFISVGIIVAGLARKLPFASQYLSDTQVDLAGASPYFCMMATILYRLNRFVHVLLQKFFAAMESINLPINQPNFDFADTSFATLGADLIFESENSPNMTAGPAIWQTVKH